MSKQGFAHLHTHTCYSLLDGVCKIPELIARTKESGMDSIAITDHGVMYGVAEFYREAKKVGVHPIIGCEVYVAPRTRWDKTAELDERPYHLVLLAENAAGYQSLIKLVSRAWLEGFYYRPRIDIELLRANAKGLIGLSACLSGQIPGLLAVGRYEQAKELALEYDAIFGRGNFFLELQDQGLEHQTRVNAGLIRVHEETGIPLVATNDVHYLRREDAFVQDVALCVQTGKILSDTDRMRFETQEFYLKNADEMALLFGDYPQALKNTVEIASRCRFDMTFGAHYLPPYPLPPGETGEAAYLRKICEVGLEERYPGRTDARGEGAMSPRERLDYELSVIENMGFPGYFLIVWDLVRYASEQGIYVGPGRGSAAGSIVSYCLRITNIDPLVYDLLFERMLNPDRISMPDIDTDVCYIRRGEIIDYVIERYGRDKVSQIVTFNTMAAKAAIRDAGRAMGVPLAVVDKTAKLVPFQLNMTLERALELSRELRELSENDEQVAGLINMAKSLEGLPRNSGVHAAGLVITGEPLETYLPLQRTDSGLPCTQFDKDVVESIGLLKMDLLGLRTLTVIGDAVKLINDSRGVNIDIDRIPLDDKNTYKILSKGDTIGVFQLESDGLRQIIRELKPDRFDDIIAMVALYRPGPLGSGMVDDYINRRHGRVPPSYPHPLLEPILKSTYGVILYQEQVMRVANDMGGFTMGQADELRRAMSKKQPEVLAKFRQGFVDGAKEKGVSEDISGKVFDLMEYFAGYGFNKSHSAAYALLAYQTAWLKTNYPVEFMAALLSSVIDSKNRVPFYINECKQRGIRVMGPDVNESLSGFSVSDGAIRFGLAGIKQVGSPAINAIIKERAEGPFTSFENFCRRVDMSSVNRRVLENLIWAGAFGSVPGNKAQLISALPFVVESAAVWQKDRASNQVSLFDLVPEIRPDEDVIELPNRDEFDGKTILTKENEVMGLYLSGHPFAPYHSVAAKKVSHNIDDLTEEDDMQVTLGGMINDYRKTVTKRGQMMANFRLEDMTGGVEALVFPKLFEEIGSSLSSDMAVLIKGRYQGQEDPPKLFVQRVEILSGSDAADGRDTAGANSSRGGSNGSRGAYGAAEASGMSGSNGAWDGSNGAGFATSAGQSVREDEAAEAVARKLPPWLADDETGLRATRANGEKRQLWIKMADQDSQYDETLREIRNALLENAGPIPVFLYYEKQKEATRASFLPKANGSAGLLSTLESLLGDEKVVLKERSVIAQ